LEETLKDLTWNLNRDFLLRINSFKAFKNKVILALVMTLPLETLLLKKPKKYLKISLGMS